MVGSEWELDEMTVLVVIGCYRVESDSAWSWSNTGIRRGRRACRIGGASVRARARNRRSAINVVGQEGEIDGLTLLLVVG